MTTILVFTLALLPGAQLELSSFFSWEYHRFTINERLFAAAKEWTLDDDWISRKINLPIPLQYGRYLRFWGGDKHANSLLGYINSRKSVAGAPVTAYVILRGALKEFETFSYQINNCGQLICEYNPAKLVAATCDSCSPADFVSIKRSEEILFEGKIFWLSLAADLDAHGRIYSFDLGISDLPDNLVDLYFRQFVPAKPPLYKYPVWGISRDFVTGEIETSEE